MIVLYAVQVPVGRKLVFTVEAVEAVKGEKLGSIIEHKRIRIHVMCKSKI